MSTKSFLKSFYQNIRLKYIKANCSWVLSYCRCNINNSCINLKFLYSWQSLTSSYKLVMSNILLNIFYWLKISKTCLKQFRFINFIAYTELYIIYTDKTHYYQTCRSSLNMYIKCLFPLCLQWKSVTFRLHYLITAYEHK